MSGKIATLFIWLVVLGPAVCCVVLHYQTNGERPPRNAMALALVWTAALLFHRQLKWDEAHGDLAETCGQLEAVYARTQPGPDPVHDSDMMTSACELAQGHAEEPIDEPH